MDNNEVYALFEDIKNDLKGINGKLENAPKITNNQSGGQPEEAGQPPRGMKGEHRMTDITLSNKEVKKMTQNNEKSVVNITVNVVGVQEANQLVERLCEKIKEARTLAGDLTSLVESLEVNIHR